MYIIKQIRSKHKHCNTVPPIERVLAMGWRESLFMKLNVIWIQTENSWFMTKCHNVFKHHSYKHVMPSCHVCHMFLCLIGMYLWWNRIKFPYNIFSFPGITYMNNVNYIDKYSSILFIFTGTWFILTDGYLWKM